MRDCSVKERLDLMESKVRRLRVVQDAHLNTIERLQKEVDAYTECADLDYDCGCNACKAHRLEQENAALVAENKVKSDYLLSNATLISSLTGIVDGIQRAERLEPRDGEQRKGLTYFERIKTLEADNFERIKTLEADNRELEEDRDKIKREADTKLSKYNQYCRILENIQGCFDADWQEDQP